MIYSIGEMLIDLMQENGKYIPFPGGAPANVAAHAKLSGANAAFIGKISKDTFGLLLTDTLKSYGIHFPLPLSSKNTTLAVVSHVRGERSFSFYRTNTADLDLDIADIDCIPFKSKDILHLCSLGLVLQGTTRQAHYHAINKCKEKDGIISFDVNLRAGLWDDLSLAKEQVFNIFELSDIIKVNEEELYWLTNSTSVEKRLRQIQTHNQLIICTMGAKGAVTLTTRGNIIHTASISVEQIDSTGAGDSFIATLLASLSKSGLELLEWQDTLLEEALNNAHKVSGQVVSKHGAVPIVLY